MIKSKSISVICVRPFVNLVRIVQQENIDIQNFRDFETLEFFARQVVEGFLVCDGEREGCR